MCKYSTLLRKLTLQNYPVKNTLPLGKYYLILQTVYQTEILIQSKESLRNIVLILVLEYTV